MNKSELRCPIFLACILILSITSQSSADYSSMDAVDKIKNETADLIDANIRLQSEHDALKDRLESLKRRTAEGRKELGILEQESKRELNPVEDPNSPEGLEKRMGSLENQIMIRETRNKQLKAEILEWREKRVMWQDQLGRLQEEKESLATDIQLQQLMKEESERKRLEEKDGALKWIDESQNREEELRQSIAELEQEKDAYPEKIRILKMENKHLETLTLQLEEKQRLIDRSVELLKDKKNLSLKKAEQELSSRQEDLKIVQEDVRRQQEQLNNLSHTVGTALFQQDEKRELVDELIELHKENEDLRQKIEVYEQRLGQLP